MIPYIVETFRVYETAKLMYQIMPSSVEIQMKWSKAKLGIIRKIEPRETKGRDSAINI